ncbi:MAG: hypothetical protein AAB778_01815 [Patescibacteria group bacterium]
MKKIYFAMALLIVVMMITSCGAPATPATITAGSTPLPQGDVRLMVSIFNYDETDLDNEYEIQLTAYANNTLPGDQIVINLINGCGKIELGANESSTQKMKLSCLLDPPMDPNREFVSAEYAGKNFNLLRADSGLNNQLMYHFIP